MSNNIALVYDFDGTLAKGNIPEHHLFPELNIEKDNFWAKVRDETQKNNCDEIFTYMYLIAEEAKSRNIKLTKEKFTHYGQQPIPYFKGVETWCERINEFCNNLDLNCKHYIISSGIEEIIY